MREKLALRKKKSAAKVTPPKTLKEVRELFDKPLFDEKDKDVDAKSCPPDLLEVVILHRALEMRKRDEQPGRVRIGFDDFASMVQRLGAKVESEGVGDRELNFITLHTAAGRLRVEPCPTAGPNEYRFEPAPPRFKVGDVVRLRTGGPKMIVDGHGRRMRLEVTTNVLDGNTHSVWCTWFSNRVDGTFEPRPSRAYFDIDTIEVA